MKLDINKNNLKLLVTKYIKEKPEKEKPVVVEEEKEKRVINANRLNSLS